MCSTNDDGQAITSATGICCTGLAICYRCPIGIRLSKACLKMMSGRPVSLEDFQEVDPQLYCTMCAIKSASEEELHAMDLTFESPSGDAFALQGSGKLFLCSMQLVTVY